MSDNETLDCAAVTPYLSPFADGELAEPLRSQVAAHIATDIAGRAGSGATSEPRRR